MSPEQKTYWNENLDPQNLGAGFDVGQFNYRQELAFYMTPDQEYALEQFEPIAGKRVIEIGAGIGTNAMYLASKGATVLATDIASDRLRALRAIAAHVIGPEAAARIIAVKCAAEALPFRSEVFDYAYSKSVIIHTRIPEAMAEIHRTMRSGAVGMFIEPMTRNPFVNLYRNTLAPKIWKQITTYFTDREIGMVSKPFSKSETRFYYLTGFLAFVWQFGVRATAPFRASLLAFGALDHLLFRIVPAAKRLAWFVAIRVTK